jgi:hypothetical protein
MSPVFLILAGLLLLWIVVTGRAVAIVKAIKG